ncbi:MAG: YbaK/EbsC family protein, partial [Coprobacillaceae bacterium]
EKELDLKKAAKVAGEKSLEMIPQKELLPLTGYVHGGCSPIGMKKTFTTFIHSTASTFENICFSGGRVGVQIQMSLLDLQKVIDIKVADIIKEI